jgi:Zn-dependent protease with chaperone function
MIETSNNKNANTGLLVFNRSILISSLPVDRSFDEIMLFVTDEYGKKYGETVIKRKPNIMFDLSHLKPCTYYFNLFRRAGNKNQYWSYFYENDLPFRIEAGKIEFVVSPVFNSNRSIMNMFRKDKLFLQYCLKPSTESQSNDKRIMDISYSITKYCNSEYLKILAIHNWVADTVSYDWDAFGDGSYQSVDTSALGVLSSKKSVCQGYTDLSVALLRAAGIPAIGLSSYALGISTEKKWSSPIINSDETNHCITLAFAENRWIIMDITWDSDNEYKNGQFEKKTGLGTMHKYFDVTLPFLSNTHKLILDNQLLSVLNNKINYSDMKKTLTGLSPDAIQHLQDKSTIDKLNKIPGFQKLVQTTVGNVMESYAAIEYSSEGLNVNARSCPQLHTALLNAAKILDVKDIPAFSTDWHYSIGSFSIGEKQKRMVLLSGVVDLLEPEELQFMIGHELGHIKCNHITYQMLTESLYLSIADSAIANVLISTIKMPLLNWYRISDYTADRAGLLCCQDIKIALSTMIKMAGLPKSCYNQININSFVQQARDFRKQTTMTDNIIKYFSINMAFHPWLVDRASELLNWYESGEYNSILNRYY